MHQHISIKALVVIVSFTLSAGCLMLTSHEEAMKYTSRTYPQPKAVVYPAALDLMKSYPMGIKSQDEAKGEILTNTGSMSQGMFGAGMIGYQVRVNVEDISSNGSRVTPFFWMNVSSDPLRPNMVPVPATDNYYRYRDFYELLEERLNKPANMPPR